jgi:Zn-dependent protease
LLNVIFAICTMLPIPPLDGVNTFFAGRLLYVTSFFGIAGAAVLIYFSNIAIAIVGGVIVMLIGTIVYYVTFENPPK